MGKRFHANENELVEALATCLDAMAAGASLESCLEMFPTLTEELRPMLTTARSSQALAPEEISTEAMNRSRTRALGYAAELRSRRKSIFGFLGRIASRGVPRFALSSILTIVLFFAGVFSLNTAAAGTLPGDSLYPLKRSFEELWLKVSSGTQLHEDLQITYSERRIDEVRALLALGREEVVTFEGVFTRREILSGIAPERWTVGDIFVLRMIDSEVVGDIKVGMLIEVRGRTNAAGFVEAIAISPKAFAFVGEVEEITPEIWTIDGRPVFIQPTTEIDIGIEVWDTVMVLATFDSQANIIARAILKTETTEEVSTPTSSPTGEAPATEPPGVTDTPTPSPSPTSSPSPTGTSTLTPSPTMTTTPEAAVPGATDEPEPAEEETEKPEPAATETISPTGDPEPSETDEPDETETEGPDGTDEPTKTPEPSKTPEPTKTPDPDDD